MAAEITTFPAPKGNLSILVLGAGGREHALSYKLAQSPRVDNVFVCPGNGGTALMGGKVQNVVIPWGGSKGYQAVVDFAKTQKIDLVVPGPEQPLVEGVEQLLKEGRWTALYQAWGIALIFSWYPIFRPLPRSCYA